MRATVGVLLLLGALGLAASAGAETRGYKLVVNKANPVSALDKAEIGKMFMKQTAKWANGQPVDPVDQAPGAAVRERFSADVHGKPVGAVQSAWQRIIFSGRGVPPPEVGSDDKVIEFVAEHAGGIGYVGEGAASDRVKVIDATR